MDWSVFTYWLAASTIWLALAINRHGRSMLSICLVSIFWCLLLPITLLLILASPDFRADVVRGLKGNAD